MIVKIGRYLVNTDQINFVHLDHTWSDHDPLRRMKSTIHFVNGRRLTFFTEDLLPALGWQVS